MLLNRVDVAYVLLLLWRQTCNEEQCQDLAIKTKSAEQLTASLLHPLGENV